jgi:hypothetical protein
VSLKRLPGCVVNIVICSSFWKKSAPETTN